MRDIDKEEVERVAEAVRRRKFERTGRLGCYESGLTSENELDDARAAIAAMPEPWRPIKSAPNVEWGKSVDALVYSPQLGIKSATVGSNNGYIFASIGSYHGNAVESWGVTHWMPLPSPPEA